MLRRIRFTVLLLFVVVAISSFAQVTVTSSGYATQSGIAVPPIPVSPPILYAPTVHLGVGPTQPLEATTPETGVDVKFEEQLESEVVAPAAAQTAPGPQTVQTAAMVHRRFEFGAAQFQNNDGLGGVGQDINGKSLAEVAREQRQRSTNANVRVYTNTNIDQLNQTGGSVNTPSATRNPSPDNWSPNNGVISPEGQPAPQSSVGGQEQPNQPANQPPTGIRPPPAPKPQSYNPDGSEATPNQPQPRSQFELRPLVKREGDEIAQNEPQNAPLAQRDQEQGTASQNQAPPKQNQAQAGQIPRTASRLPLLGVAGLFSVTMGLFVRYQRAKAR